MDIRLRRRVQPRVLETGALVKIGAGAVFISKSTGRCLLQLRNNSNKRKGLNNIRNINHNSHNNRKGRRNSKKRALSVLFVGINSKGEI